MVMFLSGEDALEFGRPGVFDFGYAVRRQGVGGNHNLASEFWLQSSTVSRTRESFTGTRFR
jgi:hypothetical protein